jgi:hypothetical protein
MTDDINAEVDRIRELPQEEQILTTQAIVESLLPLASAKCYESSCAQCWSQTKPHPV